MWRPAKSFPTSALQNCCFIRILSVGEYARIQGFPDTYKSYSSTDSTVEKYKQIGNAVSPPMAGLWDWPSEKLLVSESLTEHQAGAECYF